MLRDGLLLNGKLLEVLARAGHTDMIVIADAGLPIPANVELIDLSVSAGVPSLLEVFDAISATLVYEKVILAEEANGNPIFEDLRARLTATPIERIPHEQFKQLTSRALALVRTGEFTSYGNIALIAGVAF
jgi:D-ribose pyranase